jgi:uncharacterized phage infection (PIP) family protein YhgE
MANWWTNLTQGLGNAGNGIVGFLDNVAGSNVGQAAIDLGGQYLAAEAAERETAQPTEVKTPRTVAASGLPSWAVPAGIGVAALLTVVLIFSVTKRGR